jgi:hypothetical protein
MGIEPTSEAWEDAGEPGSFMPQLEGKTLMSEGIQPSHGRGCPQTRHSSINRPEMRQF